MRQDSLREDARDVWLEYGFVKPDCLFLIRAIFLLIWAPRILSVALGVLSLTSSLLFCCRLGEPPASLVLWFKFLLFILYPAVLLSDSLELIWFSSDTSMWLFLAFLGRKKSTINPRGFFRPLFCSMDALFPVFAFDKLKLPLLVVFSPRLSSSISIHSKMERNYFRLQQQECFPALCLVTYGSVI